jgi:hypothetical protein
VSRALLAPFLQTALLVSALASFAGCGDGVTPALQAFAFDGQAPQSTLVLLLSFDFEDLDGDLGEGTLRTFLNGKDTSAGALPLLPSFLASGLAPTATSGTVDFVLELAFPSPEEEQPDEGATFRLGARVEDAAGHESEIRELTLRIGYEP